MYRYNKEVGEDTFVDESENEFDLEDFYEDFNDLYDLDDFDEEG